MEVTRDMEIGIMELTDGYGKSQDLNGKYRFMTIPEAKALRGGERVPVLDDNGKVRTVKINGAAKTWKRTPERVEVLWKYGMYEYGRDTAIDGFMRMLLVSV